MWKNSCQSIGIHNNPYLEIHRTQRNPQEKMLWFLLLSFFVVACLCYYRWSCCFFCCLYCIRCFCCYRLSFLIVLLSIRVLDKVNWMPSDRNVYKICKFLLSGICILLFYFWNPTNKKSCKLRTFLSPGASPICCANSLRFTSNLHAKKAWCRLRIISAVLRKQGLAMLYITFEMPGIWICVFYISPFGWSNL